VSIECVAVGSRCDGRVRAQGLVCWIYMGKMVAEKILVLEKDDSVGWEGVITIGTSCVLQNMA
jgi:hypothetical protein